MNNLAFLYDNEGKFNLAEPLYVRVIEAQARTLGQQHPKRLASMSDLAALYLKQDKYTLAESLSREALNEYQNTNVTTWVRYRCESLLGASVDAQQRYAEAESRLLSGYEGLTRQQQTIPWERRAVAKECARWIVQLYNTSGRPELAAEWRRQVQSLNAAALRQQ